MRRFIAISTAAICLAVAAGCSTTSHEDVVGTTTTSSTERQRGSDTGDRDRSTVPDREGDDEGTDDTSPFDDLEDCAEAARDYLTLTLAPAALAFASGDELSEFEDDVRDLEERIPRELRDDFETVSEAYRRFAEELRSAVDDPLDPDNAQAISEAQDALDAPDVQAASDRIQSYFSERCPG
jgi:hypothetical protein